MKRKTAKLAVLLSCAVLMTSCEPGDPSLDLPKDTIDRDAHLTRDDFRNLRDLNSTKKPEVTANLSNVVEPPIPDLAEILAAPPQPKIGETQLVSLAVTDDVPLKDVLIETARLANVDIDVDAGITGGVSLRATERPFNEVIDRIAEMANLRYTMKNGVLRIERDTPYIKIYSLDLLNMDRSSQSSINSGGNSGGSAGGGSGGGSGKSVSGGGNTGSSTSSITYKTDADFWAKFESSISQILAFSPAPQTSATTMSVQPAPAAALPAAPAAPAAAGGKGVSTPAPGKPMAETASMPAAVATPAPAPAPGGQSFYILNKQAGTLTISATQKQHEIIQKFLDKVSENASSQVLIEAKVVEVDLNNNYASGINWKNFGSGNGTTSGISFTGDFSGAVASSNSTIGVPNISLIKNDILGTGLDLSAAVKLLDEFGTTRALSSPRLHAMNNQQAVLSFAENVVYFTVDMSVTDAVPASSVNPVGTPAKVSVTSTPNSAPVGIILNLQPSINKDTNEVTLSVRPTLTRLVKYIDDPGFQISLASAVSALGSGSAVVNSLSNVKSQIPQIETRELDSIVKIKSGQTLVIGGLLEDKVTNTDVGVPGASEVPVFGDLFKSVEKTNNKKELVIFIRATVVGSSGSADPYDKHLYEKFTTDPRPLKF